MKIRTFRNKVWLVRNAWLTSKCCYPMAELPSAADRPPSRQEQGTKGPPSAGWKVQREKGIPAGGVCVPGAKVAARGRTPGLEIRAVWKYGGIGNTPQTPLAAGAPSGAERGDGPRRARP